MKNLVSVVSGVLDLNAACQKGADALLQLKQRVEGDEREISGLKTGLAEAVAAAARFEEEVRAPYQELSQRITELQREAAESSQEVRELKALCGQLSAALSEQAYAFRGATGQGGAAPQEGAPFVGGVQSRPEPPIQCASGQPTVPFEGAWGVPVGSVWPAGVPCHSLAFSPSVVTTAWSGASTCVDHLGSFSGACISAEASELCYPRYDAPGCTQAAYFWEDWAHLSLLPSSPFTF